MDYIDQHFSDPSIKQTTFATVSSSSSGNTSIPPKSSLQSEMVLDLGKQLRNTANQNNVELLSRLIQENKNLDINAQDTGQHQRSVLHWAVLKPAIPCIKLLLQNNADIHLRDKSGNSSLDYALSSHNQEVLGLLLSHRYQLSLEAPFDFSRLLRCAANKGEEKIIKALLEKISNRIDTQDTGKHQRTALHWAVIGNHVECVKILLAAGARIDIQDIDKKTVLDYVYVAVSGSSSLQTLFTKSINQPATSSQTSLTNLLTSAQTLKLEVNEDEKDTKPRRGFKNESHYKEMLFKKLSPNLMLGTAYDQGDCFFDALAQCVNQVNKTDVNTAKYLRMLCHEFYSKNKEEIDKWNIKDWGGIDRGKDDYYFVQYTAEECETLFQGRRTPIWGRSHIEGIILCRELNLKGLCIIEILEDPETKQPVVSFNLVTQDACKAISEGEAQSWINNPNIPTLVVEQKSLHFVPLLLVEQLLEKTPVESLDDSFLPHARGVPSENKDERLQVTDQSSFKIYYDKLYHQYPEVKFPLFQLPFQRNKVFTGREDQLKQISEYLTTQNTLAITTSTTSQTQTVAGLGGVGKTQLVIEYAYQAQAKNSYQIIWFLNGHNLDADYLILAAQLKVYGDSKEEVIEQTKNKLQKLGNYLLVIDDAEDYESVKDYLPKTGNNGHVLITTRHKSHWQQLLELCVFNLDEALAYFKQLINYDETDRERVIYLVDTLLGRLPLALTQAGAFIKRADISVEKYIEYFETQIKVLWGVEKKPEDYSATISITWNITLSKIKETHPQAEDLLCGMSFLAPGPNVIEKDWLSGIVADESDRRESFGELAIYSMLDEQTNGYMVHQLVQEVIFNQMEFSKSVLIFSQLRDLIIKNYPYSNEQQTMPDYIKQRYLLPHLEISLSRIDALIIQNESKKFDTEKDRETVAVFLEKRWLLNLLELVAMGYKILEQLGKTKRFLTRALAIRKKYHDLDEFDLSILLSNLATTCGDLGETHQQKELLEQSLAIKEKICDPNDLSLARTLINLGNAYGVLGNSLEHKKLLKRALTIQERYYGTEHPEIAITLVGLGNSYEALGNPLKKKQLLERALLINEKYYDSNHPAIAKTLANWVISYDSQEELRKDKLLIERALLITEQFYGPNHPSVAKILSRLAFINSNLKQSNEALDAAKRACQIWKLAPDFGEQYPFAKQAKEQSDIFEFLFLDQSNIPYLTFEKAQNQKNLLEKGLKIQEDFFGLDHPAVAKTLANLGTIYGILGDASKKKSLLERSLTIKKKYYGLYHIEVGIILDNLGNVYGALGQSVEQIYLQKQALIIFEKHAGLKSIEVGRILMNLSVAYGVLNKTIIQKNLLDDALSIFKEYYPGCVELGVTTMNLAIAYGNELNYKKAVELAQYAYDFLLHHPHCGQEHQYVSRAKLLLDKYSKLLKEEKKFSEFNNFISFFDSTIFLKTDKFISLNKQLRDTISHNNASLLAQLLKENKSFNINTQDVELYRRSLLHWAVLQQTTPCIRILLQASADILLIDIAGKSSLDYALNSNNLEVLGLFLSHRYQLSLEAPFDFARLLRCAANKSEAKIIKVLLEKISNIIDVQDAGKYQRTALHWAVINGHIKCAEILLTAGARIDISDIHQKIVLDYVDASASLTLKALFTAPVSDQATSSHEVTNSSQVTASLIPSVLLPPHLDSMRSTETQPTETLELQQAIELSLQESHKVNSHATSAASSSHSAPTTFFHASTSSATANEWQKQIQANYAELQASAQLASQTEAEEVFDDEEPISDQSFSDDECLSEEDLSEVSPRPSIH